DGDVPPQAISSQWSVVEFYGRDITPRLSTPTVSKDRSRHVDARVLRDETSPRLNSNCAVEKTAKKPAAIRSFNRMIASMSATLNVLHEKHLRIRGGPARTL